MAPPTMGRNPKLLDLTGLAPATANNMDPTTSWINSPYGEAMQLNGTNQYASATLRHLVTTNNCTFVCVQKKDTAITARGSLATSGGHGLFMTFTFSSQSYTWAGGSDEIGANNGVYSTLGAWHTAMVVIRPTHATVYLLEPGKKIQSWTNTKSHSLQQITAMSIGFRTQYWLGGIQASLFINRALTPQEAECVLYESLSGWPTMLNHVSRRRVFLPAGAATGNRRRRLLICGAA